MECALQSHSDRVRRDVLPRARPPSPPPPHGHDHTHNTTRLMLKAVQAHPMSICTWRRREGDVGCPSRHVSLKSICPQRRSSSEPTKQAMRPQKIRLVSSGNYKQQEDQETQEQRLDCAVGHTWMNSCSACKVYSGGAVAPGRATYAPGELCRIAY
jgi:hypothetical protein